MRNEHTATEGGGSDASRAHAYWQSTDGFVYQAMIRDRERQGNPAYQQQEVALSRFMVAEARRLGRPIDVLEFGCGFGRHACYLPYVEGVRYHGYDFSERMIAPLRESPPEPLRPIEEHLFVGPDVAEVLGARRFDVVFTVSVLIHNAPEEVAALIDRMARLLNPGGRLLLVENRLVPFTVFDNQWHDGCWLHCFPEQIRGGWDVFLAQGLVSTHDLYLLSRNGADAPRFFRVPAPEQVDASVPLDAQQLAALGLPKLREWAADASTALQRDPGSMRVSELQERMRVIRAATERQRMLASVADELAAARAATVQVRPPRLPRREELPCVEEVAVDDPFDTRWAQVAPAFEHVVHVFHHPWHGIRAACGYLPGHKLSIPANRPMREPEARRAVAACTAEPIRAVVFHGFSRHAETLLRMLRGSGCEARTYAVWHGSTAQFQLEFEHYYFDHLLALRRKKLLDGLAGVKPGLGALSPLIHPKELLNVPPRVDPPMPRPHSANGIVYVPVRANFWKNFYTNVYAAAFHPDVREVWVYPGYERQPEIRPPARIVDVGEPARHQLLRLMARADLVLNASLTDCQPMTAVEALAVGTPCVSGVLALGELEDHPYRRLTTVSGADTLSSIQAAVGRVLALRRSEPAALAGLVEDYRATLVRTAYGRLREFLRI